MTYFEAKSNVTDVTKVSPEHNKAEWSEAAVKQGINYHAMATWTPGAALKSLPQVGKCH